MESCSQCGNELGDGAAFCSSCGTKTGHTSTTPFCWQCGTELEDGAAFCSSCGAKTGHTSTTPFCWQCGTELEDGVAFCSSCGAKAGEMPVDAQATKIARADCPYCNRSGTVVVEHVRRKKDLKSGKISANIMSVGAFLLVTGLANKEYVNQLTCTACGMRWLVR
jgi:predicted amidophosphoribosyltransferase